MAAIMAILYFGSTNLALQALMAHTSDVTTHYWDAFVIYNPEGKDLEFVKRMADILEGPEHNLKLFIPWRDDLLGPARHEVSAYLIEKRCRRAIVILSTDFPKSSAADFQLKFAHCLSPGARSRKVVPIRIDMCTIPNILTPIAICDFTKENTIEWTWHRVAASIKYPLDPSTVQYQVDYEKLKDVKLDTSSSIPRKFWALCVACVSFPDQRKVKEIENYKERYKENGEKPVPQPLMAHTSDETTHYWDAFVIYNPEGKDLKFVKRMADTLEGPKYNLRLFIPWRDDFPGPITHEVSADLIGKRCRRAIVILSTDFHKSSAADFQLKFANCLSPGARSKNVVPIRIDMCTIPNIIRNIAMCDFTREEMIEWAWQRLATSIKYPLDPCHAQYQVDYEKLRDVKLDTSSSKPREFWAL